MRKISSSKLAEMLNEGFEGTVEIEGKAYGYIDPNSAMFLSIGNPSVSKTMTLSSAGRSNGVPDNSYQINCKDALLYFKPKKGTHIESSPAYINSEVIAFPIEFPLNAIMQIEPGIIIY